MEWQNSVGAGRPLLVLLSLLLLLLASCRAQKQKFLLPYQRISGHLATIRGRSQTRTFHPKFSGRGRRFIHGPLCFATIPPLTRLRKRANKGGEGGKEAESPEKDHGTTSTGIAESSDDPQMAYGRRTINFYQRGAVGGDSVPLSSYKNKILVFLAATAVYTAFLWKSGGSFSFFSANKWGA